MGGSAAQLGRNSSLLVAGEGVSRWHPSYLPGWIQDAVAGELSAMRPVLRMID